MADHSKPLVTSTYANFVTELDSRFDDVTLWLDSATTSPTNLPTGAKRWNSASSKWEKWNGTAWSDLATAYAINLAGPSTLTAVSSSDALRITQTGTGNALVVEDETNPDSTPFVVKSDGTLLVGGTTVSSSGEKARVFGNLLIGNGQDIAPAATPNSQLVFNGNGYDGMIGLDSTGMYIGANSASRGMRFLVNETPVAGFDTSGNLGIGTTSSPYRLTVVGTGADHQLWVRNSGTAASDDAIILIQTSGSGTTSTISGLFFGDNDSSSSGQLRYNHSDDSMVFYTGGAPVAAFGGPSYYLSVYGTSLFQANITQSAGYFRNSDGGSPTSPSIQPGNDADTGMYLAGTNVIGFTTAGAQKMTIASDGQVNVIADKASYSILGQNENASPYGIRVHYTSAAPNSTGNVFYIATDSVGTKFTVRSNGGIANYSANDVNLSDRREKKDFEPSGDYLEKLCQIPVQKFRYINQAEDDDGMSIGVIAQDVQSVCPELVMESDWSNGDEGSEEKIRLSIYQTDLEYAMLRAIQELKAELDAVKSQINKP